MQVLMKYFVCDIASNDHVCAFCCSYSDGFDPEVRTNDLTKLCADKIMKCPSFLTSDVALIRRALIPAGRNKNSSQYWVHQST